jgi:predicted GIY-YIG superfamily endonuclease
MRSGDCVTATIYALCEPVSPYPKRYIGSTANLERRARLHRAARRAQWLKASNAALAEWLQETEPIVEVIAEVPEAERFDAEREITREFRKDHDLLNVLDGRKHTRESIARMLAGKARAKTSRGIP